MSKGGVSVLFVVPELVQSAAADLRGIGSELGAAQAVAAASTTGPAAAGADEVSAAVAAFFAEHGRQFHAVSVQAGAFHHNESRSATKGACATHNSAHHRSSARQARGVSSRKMPPSTAPGMK